jgi:predicted Zn-dependent protease with MMP-like domain
MVPQPMNRDIERARDLLWDGQPEEALAVLDGLGQRDVEPEDRRERLTLVVESLLELGDIDEALDPLNQALSLGDNPSLRCLEARVRLAGGSPAQALVASERAVLLDPRDPASHHARGIVLTALGRLKDADRAFELAVELDPETYFKPYRLRRKDFDQVVEQALFSLPEDFRRHLANVEVAVEDVPRRETLGKEMSSDLLGLYRGRTIHTDSCGLPALPDQILLFQRNIENVSPDRQHLLREIRDTVLHEVGHHLGLDEGRLQAIEDGWKMA